MNEFDPEIHIRGEHGHHPSVDDQINLAKLLYEWGVTPGQERRRAEIAELLEDHNEELDHTLRTVLDNLEEIDVVESFYPHDGNRWFPISERLDEVVLGKFEEVVKTDQRRFIRHMDSGHDGSDSRAAADGGVSIRTVLAGHFDVMPENVETVLRQGDINEQRDTLNEAIWVVDQHDELENGDNYGRVVWRHMALRYQLTAWAINAFAE